MDDVADSVYDSDNDDDYSADEDEIENRRLVISIDFGTTYTGIAFATPLGSSSKLNDIDIVLDWGENMGNMDKVPSVISYSNKSKDGNEANWGKDLAPGAVAMKHMKLRLQAHSVSNELEFLLQFLDGTRNLDFAHIKDSKGMPEYTAKAPEDITSDYLAKVFEHVLQTVNGFSKTVRETIPTDIVITIPVDWGYDAMNSTYRAVTKAGFNEKTFPKLEDVMFVTEPEAAAIYTARYYEELNEQFLKEDECFILVDAGGGTVDIVSYQVKRLRPLELVPVGVPTGARCGAIFVDQAFNMWLRHLLTDRYYLELDPDADLNNIYGIQSHHIREIMDEFDIIKKYFHQESGDMFMDLPRSSPLRNLTLENRVDCGQITIKNETMRDFFNPCVDEIIEMIKLHIREIESHGSRAKNLFLIGGFGESKFLQEEIRDSLRMRSEIALRMPETSWTAVARGGVICGVEKKHLKTLVRTSRSQKSYGIAVDESFSYANDARDLDTNRLTGKRVARNQMKWLINKGDLILNTTPTIKEHKFVKRFVDHEAGSKKGSVVIYSWPDDKHRPTRLSNAHRELMIEEVLNYDLSSLRHSDFTLRRGPSPNCDHYVATINLRLSLTRTGLKSELLFKGEPLPAVSTGSPPMQSTIADMHGVGVTPDRTGLGRGSSFTRRSERRRLNVSDPDFEHWGRLS
ncbi:uncharacterized protein PV09_01906 [Verruconis gallopava]|uniref:Actin-like ATPase domain-containing protein n=1 Tax=Verruconis gallopava TaxID=253628 RepID=A0A0D1XWB4_9PEZI|nr:uncharacterized protein PV09_01906 [Verruconis gallopava]KIW07011.1 hypothetical protein PV09_01906 [Verruconis gallopava]